MNLDAEEVFNNILHIKLSLYKNLISRNCVKMHLINF